MRFYTRLGAEITADHWRQLHADRTYATVAQDWRAGLRVVTSWVGVSLVPAEPEPPRLFLTEVLPVGEVPKRHHGDWPRVWAATEALALQQHRRQLEALGKR